ncbi:Berberine and berberine like protein [compost metagenome]
MAWCSDFYKDYFSNQNFKPYKDNGRYQGCYINYPDIDMKYIDADHKIVDSRWLELYYGNKTHQLIATKIKFDPHNIFRSELSVPLYHP